MGAIHGMTLCVWARLTCCMDCGWKLARTIVSITSLEFSSCIDDANSPGCSSWEMPDPGDDIISSSAVIGGSKIRHGEAAGWLSPGCCGRGADLVRLLVAPTLRLCALRGGLCECHWSSANVTSVGRVHRCFPSWVAASRTGIAQFFNRPRRATPSLKRILARPEHSMPFLMHLPHEGSTLSQTILLFEHWKQPIVRHQQNPPSQIGMAVLYLVPFWGGAPWG